jgi:organic hydroperoxide reductase OsmC/OhrA
VGVMTENAQGVPWMSQISLHPRIAFGGEKVPTAQELQELHHGAHEQCYIANSVKTEIIVSAPVSA